MTHLACGAEWDHYCSEWPPKVVVCPSCHVAMKLIMHDLASNRLAYRRI